VLPGAAAIASAFAVALTGGDAEAAASYFSPVALFLTPDGTEVNGRRAIGGLLAQLTSSEQRLEIRRGRTVVNSPVALATQYWIRRSRRLDKERFEASSAARLVLTRSSAGIWEIVIASPWG
jgi:ketosteroid isomerase-like protein